MNVDRAVLTLAGSMVLTSLALAWLISPYWLLLTAFVGANLFQAAFTGFCPAAIIFRKMGLKTGPAFECPPARADESAHASGSAVIGSVTAGTALKVAAGPQKGAARE